LLFSFLTGISKVLRVGNHEDQICMWRHKVLQSVAIVVLSSFIPVSQVRQTVTPTATTHSISLPQNPKLPMQRHR
jgi:hypothetical protein